MCLRRVQVTDFRCLQSANLELDSQFTLISGPNASGKTSLLEALYVLGRGRSFRTRRLEHLIRHGSGSIRSLWRGRFLRPPRSRLGWKGLRAGIRGQVAGARAASLAELAAFLPVQIIDPEIHRLIEEGPGRRRRFLDWGVFHVEQRSWSIGSDSSSPQAEQRGAQVSSAAMPWHRHGTATWCATENFCRQARARYVELLAAQASSIGRNLLGMELSIELSAGLGQGTRPWRRPCSRAGITIRRAAHTQVGPHRAELSIRLNELSVKDRISRGQQKLLAAALLMAQIKLFPEGAPVQPSLLLDDPAAELDNSRLTGLIARSPHNPCN